MRCQYLRRDRRSGPKIAPGDKEAASRKSRRESVGYGLRRANRPGRFRAHAGSRRRDRQQSKDAARDVARVGGLNRDGAVRRSELAGRHHGCEEGFSACCVRPGCEFQSICPSSERMRPSMHVLHHSIRARQFQIRLRRRHRRSSQGAGRKRISRGRSDRRRHYLLGQ